ncbi:hypothetical protein QRZ34_28475 [Klebsiella michiganensis]|jgi:methylenetetrahydrofolate reductase (NADPH)|uniref:hypothetical protein n=1 Tax=Klebsiella michiganensis TaxID=1134687 RepID=UPI002570CC0D|nr:hypothetical protein [Klebsiella michiganensis]MDL4454933.1 hypothetical protein [Klebsiella michiganensis]
MSNTQSIIRAERFIIEIAPQQIDEFYLIADKLTPGSRVSLAYHSKASLAEHVRAARRLNELGFRPWPHIAARHLRSVKELDDFLNALVTKSNIDRCVIIAGHIPHPEGPFSDSLDVINSGLLQKYKLKEIAVAGHPSGHLNLSPSCLSTLLHQKIHAITRAGMNASIITQYELEAAATLSWIEDLRKQGIDAPVYIGMLGPAEAEILARIVKSCDSFPSQSAQKNYGLFSGAGTFITPDKLMNEYSSQLNTVVHGQFDFHIAYGKLNDIASWVEQWVHFRQ